MRYFKLKALSCSGKGNRVIRKRDNQILEEGAFHDADHLLSAGYIVQVTKSGSLLGTSIEEARKQNETQFESTLLEGVLDAVINQANTSSPIDGKTVKDFKKGELQNLCDDAGIAYADDDTKAILFKELKNHYNV